MTVKNTHAIIVQDDFIKNILKGGILLLILFALLFSLQYCYRNLILAPLIILFPSIIYAVKWSYIYLHRGITRNYIFRFCEDYVQITHYFKKDTLLHYDTIQEIQILSRSDKFADVFIRSDKVSHPSGMMHFRLRYPFNQKMLKTNTELIILACKSHHLKCTTVTHGISENSNGK